MPKAVSIYDRNHTIQSAILRQIDSLLFINISKCLRDRDRLADSCRFNQYVVKAIFSGQHLHFLQQILAKRAADTTIGHFHQLLIGTRQAAALCNQIGVNVNLAQVIYNDGNLQSLAIVQYMIHNRGFARTQISAQHRYRNSVLVHN
ncbi:hypothetical protein D3C78_1317580 [compost metagenome]